MFKRISLMLLSIAFLLPITAQDIKLSAPNKTGGKPLMQALSERKSSRNFVDKELSIDVLSNLMWAANGFNRDDKRTAPTANNKQEIELYVAIKSGVYLFAASEGLGSVSRGWFDKDVLAELLDLPPHKKVLLTQSVGVVD